MTDKEKELQAEAIDYYRKQIAELEKENAELKKELEKETAHRIRNFNKAIEWKEKYKTLKKENAELQQKWLNESYEKAKLVEKWKHNGENIIQECKDIEGANAFYEHQLTKAKEIIKTFLGFAEAFGYSPSMDKFITETEQFLKECK